jgi:hypothetical protein
MALRTAKNAYSGDKAGFDGSVIVGLGMVFGRYNGKTNERNLAEALGMESSGVRGLLRRAESQRERTGNEKVQCVAAAIVDVYNKRANRAHKLPSWWKQAEAD